MHKNTRCKKAGGCDYWVNKCSLASGKFFLKSAQQGTVKTMKLCLQARSVTSRLLSQVSYFTCVAVGRGKFSLRSTGSKHPTNSKYNAPSPSPAKWTNPPPRLPSAEDQPSPYSPFHSGSTLPLSLSGGPRGIRSTPGFYWSTVEQLKEQKKYKYEHQLEHSINSKYCTVPVLYIRR